MLGGPILNWGMSGSAEDGCRSGWGEDVNLSEAVDAGRNQCGGYAVRVGQLTAQSRYANRHDGAVSNGCGDDW